MSPSLFMSMQVSDVRQWPLVRGLFPLNPVQGNRDRELGTSTTCNRTHVSSEQQRVSSAAAVNSDSSNSNALQSTESSSHGGVHDHEPKDTPQGVVVNKAPQSQSHTDDWSKASSDNYNGQCILLAFRRDRTHKHDWAVCVDVRRPFEHWRRGLPDPMNVTIRDEAASEATTTDDALNSNSATSEPGATDSGTTEESTTAINRQTAEGEPEIQEGEPEIHTWERIAKVWQANAPFWHQYVPFWRVLDVAIVDVKVWKMANDILTIEIQDFPTVDQLKRHAAANPNTQYRLYNNVNAVWHYTLCRCAHLRSHYDSDCITDIKSLIKQRLHLRECLQDPSMATHYRPLTEVPLPACCLYDASPLMRVLGFARDTADYTGGYGGWENYKALFVTAGWKCHSHEWDGLVIILFVATTVVVWRLVTGSWDVGVAVGSLLVAIMSLIIMRSQVDDVRAKLKNT